MQAANLLCLILASLHLRRAYAYTPERARQLSKEIFARIAPEVYDKRERPFLEKGQPVVIYYKVEPRSLSSVREDKMEYTFDFILTMFWVDDRLMGFDLEAPFVLTPRANELWHPDVFFSNLKHGSIINMTQRNWAMALLQGDLLLLGERLILKLGCDMDLRYFPWDTQICNIVMESYAYMAHQVAFEWVPWGSGVNMLWKIQLPEFKFVAWKTEDCTATYSTGTFPCLRFKMALQRQTGYYMTQVYIPGTLTVVVSWVSFWIGKEAEAARMSVGLLTILTTSAQISSLSLLMPKVSYVKAIDVWNSTCLIFIFASIMQYIIVNYYWRFKEGEDSKDGKDATETPDTSNGVFTLRGRDKADQVDAISRLAFPVCFTLFCFGYWIHYIVRQPSIYDEFTPVPEEFL